ncbi:PREDICTED: late embryogenesis abundant protein At1g64065-like [Camelina sativa]|uniref:Late embryogenesis abundant protein At1g64065-like n=1 Tax=Camelina sativa TaxID=90675 RepID=A0ABM0SZM9_CAMSA|nr:PREDICTED: late embryogenesis abundant protein At1g64065-like [Camelina sativa]
MVEEDRITLAPTEIYGRSDEEQNEPRIWRRKTEEPPGKCLIYTLTIIVIIFAVFLILSSIFLRISTPEIETTSVSTRDLRFGGNSTNPYFNATLVSDITIRNSNFGAFEFEDGSLRVVYADHGVVGVTTIEGRRVEAHKTVKITCVVVEIGSFRLLDTKGLDSDLRLGFLELRSVAEIRGRIKVLGRRRWKVSVMSCTMRLNLTGRFIQHLLCE